MTARDDSPTAAEIAAAAPDLSPAARERLRRALTPPPAGRADIRRSAAHSAVSCRRDGDRLTTRSPR